jgi:hypothetical protein
MTEVFSDEGFTLHSATNYPPSHTNLTPSLSGTGKSQQHAIAEVVTQIVNQLGSKMMIPNNLTGLTALYFYPVFSFVYSAHKKFTFYVHGPSCKVLNITI